VGASLAAFVVVYLPVFGFGVHYLLRLMKMPPAALQQPVAAETPIRSAGIAPAAAVAAQGAMAAKDNTP
jgi:cytochrome d ubiquinol oxidase subunit I